MNVIGEVVKISIDVPIEKKDGGSYPGWKLVYEDQGGDVKSVCKHMNGLKYNKQLKAGLESLVSGDKFTLTQEKNDKGYWEPKTIVKGEVAPQQTSTQPSGGKPVVTSGGGGGNWPTAEERKATQTHIIRQNSITNAVAFMNVVGNKKATEEDVIRTAARFEEFIHNGISVLSSTGGIEDMEDYLLFESGVE